MKVFKAGCGLIILGIAMFIVGISLFAYRGAPFPGMITIGELSFVLWLPMLALGIILIIINSIVTKKKQK